MLSIEEIKLLIEKLEKLKKEDFTSLIEKNLEILKDLRSAVEKNNEHLLNKDVAIKNIPWFNKDLEFKREKPYVSDLLARQIQLKIFQFGRNNTYNSLEIGPGNGQFSKDFRTWRLNFYLDIIPGYEKRIRRLFPALHQKYLKFFMTQPHTPDITNIPQGSISLAFSWDTFVFMNTNTIQHYLHGLKRVLIPGGYVFIQYSDCHYDHDLSETKRGYWSYNSKTQMTEIIKSEGYEVIEMSQFCPGANYAIFRKPGNQNPIVYKISNISLD